MKEMKKTIREIVEKYTGILIMEDDKNFFEYDIFALDLLYVIRDIENIFGVAAKNIFSNADYHLLSISNITKKITELSKGN